MESFKAIGQRTLKTRTLFSKSKKEHNLVEMLDRVIKSLVVCGGIMVNKCAKFQSN